MATVGDRVEDGSHERQTEAKNRHLLHNQAPQVALSWHDFGPGNQGINAGSA